MKGQERAFAGISCMHDRQLLMYKRKERTNLSQKQKRKAREETFLFVRKGRKMAPMKEREETCLFVRKGREKAPMKGQGRNLSIFVRKGREPAPMKGQETMGKQDSTKKGQQ
jgi:hypothetical protein